MKSKIPSFLLLILVFCATLGPLMSPYSPSESNLSLAMQPASLEHLLGTDENGRDILSRLLFGARISLGISVAVVLLALTLGLGVGFLAGYFGGWVEKIFLAVSDLFQAFPGTLLAIAVAAFLPPGILNLIFLLSAVGWVGYARLTRAQVLSLKKQEFIQAQMALGGSLSRLFIRHFLPNMAAPLLVQATFGLAGVILVESTLSFLGLGLPVNLPSWGRMLDNGTALLLVSPHISIFPGLAIMITILTFNLLGDQLRKKI